MRYAVIIEKGSTSFGAYVPELPGCVAVGKSREEVLQLIQEAVEFHLEGLRKEWQPISVQDAQPTAQQTPECKLE